MFFCVVFFSPAERGREREPARELRQLRGYAEEGAREKKKKKVWMGGGVDATKKSDRWKSQHTHGT